MSARKRRMLVNANTNGDKKKSFKFFSGPIVFAIMLAVVILGSIELISTIRSYALSLAELHTLQNEEASLQTRKNTLLNNIDRWKDKAYVATRARDRLGFVFPGEQAVRVEHPEAVTGKATNNFAEGSYNSASHTALPWYSNLSYALHKADKPENMVEHSQDKNADSNITRTNN